MKVLVLFDSYFGNTEKVARAVADGLASSGEVSVQRVSQVKAEQLAGLDLLVVGSPTRGFRPSEGTAAFLKGLSADGLKGVRFAAFDTRIDYRTIKSPIFRFIVHRGGYAAPRIAAALAKLGGAQAAVPEGFYVLESEGPMKEGELERAKAWAARLAE